MMYSEDKYLKLLSEKYPTEQSVYKEIINLNAILNLPKGTEHFMSDIHGEYEAFCHIINNCSGVIREKVDKVFEKSLSNSERRELCTLIYYPREKLILIKEKHELDDDWYRMTLNQLIEVARVVSSKYTRSKVRKALPQDFSYIIDELLHVQPDEDNNQIMYHEKILDTIINIKSADDFIVALTDLIKRLAVDHLHIVGDIFDRGPYADKILDMLMTYHSLDIEWGNHDVLWIGACAGSEACIANVIRNNLGNMDMLESGYGISLRELTLFAEKTYKEKSLTEATRKAISVILFKLSGQIADRHPEFNMSERDLLGKMDLQKGTVKIDGIEYKLNTVDFPTVRQGREYVLTAEEAEIMDNLRKAFTESIRLNEHIGFLCSVGSMYLVFNNNLLYHGCVPLDESGNFDKITYEGREHSGKEYFDYAEKKVREAFSGERTQSDLDFIWYLWCGEKSILCGRKMKTFERTFIDDESAHIEEPNAYYTFHDSEKTCDMILREFGIYTKKSHIINGHTPIKAYRGEHPVKANGRLIIIDGGFCKKYHKTTGIAGYTLIYNSHGMRIKEHQPFESVEKALTENKDIESNSDTFETGVDRMRVKDTDTGKEISEQIKDLEKLLEMYRQR